MRISIITASLNNKEIIEDCIKSVLGQTYKDIEYIVIDGGSTDGTVEIIQKYRRSIAKFISEKDQGLYFALNKGLAMATGDIIGLLHTDDMYAQTDMIQKVADVFARIPTDSLYGNLAFVTKNNNNRIIRYWHSFAYKDADIEHGWMPPHPALFVKKKIYERYGYFNTDFKIAADYELMLRFFYRHKISTYFLDELIIRMRQGGLSNRCHFIKWFEDYRACKMYGLGLTTVIGKRLSKVCQFIRIR